jgi:hypothetical protein
MNSRIVPLIVLALFATAVFLLQRSEREHTENIGRLAVREDPSRDAVVLSWSSEVAAPMGRRFEEAYDAYRDEVSLFVLELNSPGGLVSEGRRVIALLERMERTHDIETRVRAGRICLSMCVPIYLKGDRRVASPDARFMFHEPASYDSYTGERGGGPAFERRFIADRFFDRYFENSPMDPEWRRWLEREWVGKDVWKTGRQLADERSGVVTDLQAR